MSDQVTMGELEIEVLDLTRRLDRIEGDQVKFDSRQKNIEEQVMTLNANLKRFWERDWPVIEKLISDTKLRLDELAKDNVEARIRSAVEVERDSHVISGLRKETETLRTELDAQRSIILKMLLSAGAGGFGVVAVFEGIRKLFGG